jgi:hypothetical protein
MLYSLSSFTPNQQPPCPSPINQMIRLDGLIRGFNKVGWLENLIFYGNNKHHKIKGLHARDFMKSWQMPLFLEEVTFFVNFCFVA